MSCTLFMSRMVVGYSMGVDASLAQACVGRCAPVPPSPLFRLAAVADRQWGRQVSVGVQGGYAANRENTSEQFTGRMAGFWRPVGLPSHQ